MDVDDRSDLLIGVCAVCVIALGEVICCLDYLRDGETAVSLDQCEGGVVRG